MIMDEFDTVVDKCQVTLVTDPAETKKLLRRAGQCQRYDTRDDRLASMTDESVDQFYTCILCQAFAPAHCCVVTPERLGLCGAVSWLDAKATNELDPSRPLPAHRQGAAAPTSAPARYEHRQRSRGRSATHGALESRHAVLPPRGSHDLLRLLRVHLRRRARVQRALSSRCREYAGMTPAGHDLRRDGLHDRRRRADPRLHGPWQALHRLQEVHRCRRRPRPYRLAAQGAEGADARQA